SGLEKRAAICAVRRVGGHGYWLSTRESTGNMVVTRYLLTMILPTSTRVSKRRPVGHLASAWFGISARVSSMMIDSKSSAARRTSELLSPSWRIKPGVAFARVVGAVSLILPRMSINSFAAGTPAFRHGGSRVLQEGKLGKENRSVSRRVRTRPEDADKRPGRAPEGVG